MYSSSLKKYEDEKEFFTFPICAFNTSVDNMHFGFCYIFMTFFFIHNKDPLFFDFCRSFECVKLLKI